MAGDTEIEKHIYANIPKEGLKLKEGQDYRFPSGLPDREAQRVSEDRIVTRAEYVGMLAAAGNKNYAREKVTPQEIKAMENSMEKWGLDPSDPAQKRMIIGLTKFEKALSKGAINQSLQTTFTNAAAEKSKSPENAIANTFNTKAGHSEPNNTFSPMAIKAWDLLNRIDRKEIPGDGGRDLLETLGKELKLTDDQIWKLKHFYSPDNLSFLKKTLLNDEKSKEIITGLDKAIGIGSSEKPAPVLPFKPF